MGKCRARAGADGCKAECTSDGALSSQESRRYCESGTRVGSTWIEASRGRKLERAKEDDTVRSN